LLSASPSLRRVVEATATRQLAPGLRVAAAAMDTYGEAPRVRIEGIRYSVDQVLGDWLPDDVG
jgi:hypothetical protein